MPNGIDECLRPAFFVSYSRRQGLIAAELKAALDAYARSVWFDIDAIQPGDDWRREIRSGIAGADEIVLLVSDDSLRSAVVQEEIDVALAGQKHIIPVIVGPLTAALPPDLAKLHYLDLSSEDAATRRARIARTFGAPVSAESGAFKLAACRGVWPDFEESSAEAQGRVRAATIAAQLDAIRSAYAPASCIWLNAGLQACIAGAWDDGIATLRAHAHAANTLAGWYFLALHLPRRELVLRMPSGAAKESLSALAQAEQLGASPLLSLLQGVVETGGANLGSARLEQRMRQLAGSVGAIRERPGEYMRAFWCLKPSFVVLGAYETSVKSLIRGMIQ